MEQWKVTKTVTVIAESQADAVRLSGLHRHAANPADTVTWTLNAERVHPEGWQPDLYIA